MATPENKIIGIEEREARFDAAVRVQFLERLNPDGFSFGHQDLTNKQMADEILSRTPLGIKQIRMMERFMGAHPEIGFNGLIDRLEGTNLRPVINSTPQQTP